MKRIRIQISSLQHSDRPPTSGYALEGEIRDGVLSFYSHQKFSVDEPLELKFHFKGRLHLVRAQFRSVREEISSGKVMNGLPVEGQPFPARTFYRCFADVDEVFVELENPEAQSDPGERPGLSLVENSISPEDLAEQFKVA